MSDSRKCTYCNAEIKGDAFCCPCGVFYHPGCVRHAVNKSTGKRKCCSHKPTTRYLSPTTSNDISIDQISEILNEHYIKAKRDSEKLIGDKINVVVEKIVDMANSVSAFFTKLNDAVDRIDNLECEFQEFQEINTVLVNANSAPISGDSISSKCLS